MSRVVVVLTFVTLLGGCAGGIVGPGDGAMPAHGLLASIAVPGRCLNGGCDPFSTQLTRLGLVTLTNTGNARVFVPLCGPVPVLQEQQFINGQWSSMAIGVDCPVGPISRVIQPHDSLQVNVWFGVGTWRVTIGAAADTALVTEAVSTSAPVAVK